MKASVSIQQIYAEVGRMDPNLKIGADTFKAAVVMLSALSVGQHVTKLEKFTGLPKADIKKFAKNLKKNGVWKNNKLCSDWFKKGGEGTITFWLDVSAAIGHIERVP